MSYAQYALGKLYRDGGTAAQTDTLAVIWFSEAAEQGHEYAHVRPWKAPSKKREHPLRLPLVS
ncbi:SEL1-like repeat protein [uncultured Oscillibacter sp.]|uniref:SEL1-like repeat protein n=1 Tax=uncultured Oscillibacter sp. TaxID=876091 RepID=UPI002D7FAC37|nr:SEL1-like repeat protein [uncultured Oscillibacter sp.]